MQNFDEPDKMYNTIIKTVNNVKYASAFMIFWFGEINTANITIF